MSKISLEPNDSGAGTFSIVSPDSNTNRTLNLPDEAGKLLSTGNNDPAEVFKQSNILGTVSESGGVPTGAIIERGSNSNGEFIKYADGTLICTGRTTTTTQVFTDTGTYEFKYDQRSSTFPAEFAFVPQMVVSFLNMGPYNTANVEGGNNSTTTTSTGRIRGASGSSNRTDGRYGWIAIGRWY